MKKYLIIVLFVIPQYSFSIEFVKKTINSMSTIIDCYSVADLNGDGNHDGREVYHNVTFDVNNDGNNDCSRNETLHDLESFAAGTMAFSLNRPVRNLNQAGVLSLDVTYPGDEGGRWIRDNIQIALFSNPRGE